MTVLQKFRRFKVSLKMICVGTQRSGSFSKFVKIHVRPTYEENTA